MFKRLFASGLLWCAVAASVAVVPLPAAAQDHSYFTYVSWWAVPRDQWAAFDKQSQAADAQMKSSLADGTIVAWGDVTTRVHEENGYTHAEFFTATSRDKLLKALEGQWAGATNAAFVSATKHRDALLATLAHGGKTSSGATGYVRVTFWQAKPGAEQALEGYVIKSVKPVLDAAVASGTLLMYNFDKEDVHSDAPGGYNLALFFSNGAALDKFFNDLAAAGKSDPTLGEVIDNLTVAKEHRDTLSRLTAYGHE
ncbi:MAG TPA: hypothetical protein VI455_14440 [Terriglobia bacterium]